MRAYFTPLLTTLSSYGCAGILLTCDDRNDAPRYDPGFQATVICFGVCFVLAQVFRALMLVQNKRRDREYGAPTSEHGLEDLTDGVNKSFRYSL